MDPALSRFGARALACAPCSSLAVVTVTRRSDRKTTATTMARTGARVGPGEKPLDSFHRPSPANLNKDLFGAPNRVRNRADRGRDVRRAGGLSQLSRKPKWVKNARLVLRLHVPHLCLKEERLRTKPAALHQKRSLTVPPLGPQALRWFHWPQPKLLSPSLIKRPRSGPDPRGHSGT